MITDFKNGFTCISAMNRKKQLLYRRNCSNRNRGMNVRNEYFAVVMWLFLYFAGWWGALTKITLSSPSLCCVGGWSSPWEPPFSALIGPTVTYEAARLIYSVYVLNMSIQKLHICNQYISNIALILNSRVRLVIQFTFYSSLLNNLFGW